MFGVGEDEIGGVEEYLFGFLVSDVVFDKVFINVALIPFKFKWLGQRLHDYSIYWVLMLSRVTGKVVTTLLYPGILVES